MAELHPYPFSALVTRAFDELERKQSIFDLPARKFFLGDPDRDLSVQFHGKRASTPFGPAAGPHTQLAQNLVLAWLGGGRIHELKTVQILDTLMIPRPCIDMATVGYNVEWSQELRLEQSLDEYVKAAMLIRMLVESGKLGLRPGATDLIFDMSVGYDLAGIRSERVQAFMRGMLDATPVIARLRREIPDALAHLRDLDFAPRLSDTLTLSTFHGCPPDEIERIIAFLLQDVGLHCIVKLNPTLLGRDRVRELMHDVMGYTDIRVPDAAFDKDARWDQACGFVDRLGGTAAGLGLGFGVKFSNTLIVENHRGFFPASEREMYLSGPPLHVLAMSLVGRFRDTFGDRFPISFSAGIDRQNFADTAALGIVPITVCSDLLQPGGYARASGYLTALSERMASVGATTIDDFVLRAFPGAPEGETLAQAKLRNTGLVVDRLLAEPRYHQAKNQKPPKKIGRSLKLFDCITCDKCVPVCPNDANFTFAVPTTSVPVVWVTATPGGLTARTGEAMATIEKHQIGTFHDFCNECGNCDIFCPEDGGPYKVKPRFFGSLESFRQVPGHDGFHFGHGYGIARIAGRELRADYAPDGRVRYSGDGFALEFSAADPLGTLSGTAEGAVDLTWFYVLDTLRKAVLAPETVSYVGPLAS